jgi:hypothetical protein
MAVTAQQQYFADVAQSGDQEACCIALGGQVGVDDEGEQICSVVTGNLNIPDLFYLNGGGFGPGACGYATQLAESAPTQGGQSAGGFLGQISAETAQTGLSILDGLVNIFRKPQPPTAAPAATPPADVQENQVTTKQIITAVAVILGLVVVVYLIRKK